MGAQGSGASEIDGGNAEFARLRTLQPIGSVTCACRAGALCPQAGIVVQFLGPGCGHG